MAKITMIVLLYTYLTTYLRGDQLLLFQHRQPITRTDIIITAGRHFHSSYKLQLLPDDEVDY